MTKVQGSLEDVTRQALDSEARVSTSANKDEALKFSIEAAEKYIQALTLTSLNDERIRLRERCNALLNHAELIKNSGQWKPSSPFSRSTSSRIASSGQGLITSRQPCSSRQLTKREQIILLEGSKLNGSIFPQWQSPPDRTEFDFEGGQEKFIDVTELNLSALQRDLLDGWNRPEEILRPEDKSHTEEKIKTEPAVGLQGSVDLVQDVTTDCSVVASLCSITAREQRGQPNILPLLFHPYDTEQERPAVSPNGKYVFRLHFNGCHRRVVIDDRLPTSRTSRVLYVIDRNDPYLIWPALVEKAYLKVRGGYDFPGSNSGTDLWILTGWIPEQVLLQSEDTISNDFSHRIWNAFHYGDVLVTLGTGKMTPQEEEDLGLASEHDYAVLDMKEIGGSQFLLVKNPWSEGTVWRSGLHGSKAPANTDVDTSNTFRTEVQKSVGATSGLLTPGTFWIDFNGVMQNFESIYLNWNPCLFSCRQDIHFTWDLAVARGFAGCFASNPQYAVGSTAGGVVWILLSRHFKTGEGRPNLGETLGPAITKGQPGFISLYAFSSCGKRVLLSDGALHRGPYVDSPQTLLRLDFPPKTTLTVAVSEQSLQATKCNLTISAFSRTPVSLEPALERYRHFTTHSAAWTQSSAGGNASAASYPTNPQFSLHLCAPSNVALFLETTVPDISVHVKLVWGDGKRVISVAARDIVGASGDYRRGCALAEIQAVNAGAYSIVCSTFEPGQLGNFILRVGTMVDCVVRPILNEEAGRLSMRMPLAIFPPGVERILAPLSPQRLMKLKAIARHHRSSGSKARGTPRSPISLGLELNQGPNKAILAVSGDGEFSDAPVGVRVNDVDWSPDMQRQGGMWIVLERLGGSSSCMEELIEVELLCEGNIQLGEWGIGDG
ncbi:MAG: cysteine protease [Candelina submexicana]|nr:MAG: cysteine protease [Candelina submexicana]